MSRPRVCAILIGLLTVAGCSQRVPQPHFTILPPDLVLVSRVGSSAITPHPAGCPLQTYERMPSGLVRDLGSIELAGSVPAGGDIFAAVDQKACESGADAIVIAQREQRNLPDRTEYHVIAEAILTHPQAAVASPAPTESAEAPGAAENGGAETKLAALPTPSELLMQPVGADANNQGDSNALPQSSAMTESSIGATEAAPLALAVASPAPIASAVATATALPTATPSATTTSSVATPTSTATPTPESTATATSTPTVTLTPTATPTREATETTTPTPTVTLTPVVTPTATSTDTPTRSMTATASPTPTSTPDQSPGSLEATATPSPTITPTPSPTTSSAISLTLESAAAALAATPTSSPGFAAAPDSQSSPAQSGD